jgi:MarR family transcriptional regulator, organic hydroperoxide resistance regulator
MEKLSLKNQMCFKFYALSRHITSVYKPLLDELGITYPQYLVMLVLWERECISVKDIGQHLMLDSGTLTPLLKRLEQKGLLTRKRSAGDERVVEVRYQSITLDPAELRQFDATLDKLMHQIPDYG